MSCNYVENWDPNERLARNKWICGTSSEYTQCTLGPSAEALTMQTCPPTHHPQSNKSTQSIDKH